MLQDQGFLAVRSGGDHGNRPANQFRDALDVILRILWQVFKAFDADGVFFPARHFFIAGFTADHIICIGREDVNNPAIHFITDTDLDGFQTIQDIQLGQAETAQPIQLGGTAQQCGIKLATTAWTAGNGAELHANG